MSASRDVRTVKTADVPAGVAVVTDSTSYLPRELVDLWGIREVSLYVGWGGDLRPEHQYDDLDAFYARLRESRLLPATSQPAVGDFLACFEPLVSAGRDVVSVHLASGLSGTCESAAEAARIVANEGHPPWSSAGRLGDPPYEGAGGPSSIIRRRAQWARLS